MVKKSISAWVSCTGTTDDSEAAAQAFHAASGGAFTLVVDCPVLIHIGVDIARPIFIESGTTVEFTSAGKFMVDNVLVPAFVLANTQSVVMTNWNVEYDGGLPVNMQMGGYANNGTFYSSNGNAPPASAFTNERISDWLTKNRGIVFDQSQGNVFSVWAGPTNTSSVFFLTGDTSNITVTGMSLYAPATAGGSQFLPMAFSMTGNYKSNQTVTASTPLNSQYLAIPHDLSFSNIYLDGIYMGWQGNVQNLSVDTVRSHRYGDLQDANGNNVGGVGKWFAPPHLFYITQNVDGDSVLLNRNIQIHDVVDAGPRIGRARDLGGFDTISGFAESLKIGCQDCSVDTYTSNRLDGFMDVLSSNGLTISNVTATYNSAFVNNVYSSWRFPQPPYNNVTFQNISLTDTAPATQHFPITSVVDTSSGNIVFSNVQVTLNKWIPDILPIATFAGSGNSVSLVYTITGNSSNIRSLDQSGVRVTLLATPATVQQGESSTLRWSTWNANSCSATNAWDGAVSGEGQRTIKGGDAGTYNYVLSCQNAGAATSVAMPLVVQ